MTGSKDKMSILCVDDTPVNLTLLNEFLSPYYHLSLTNSGPKALKLLERKADEMDLILLDVMMPEMDGYEVCRRIRSNPKTQHLPIIFITAKNRPQDEAKALDEGGNDFITKPIQPEVLLSRIKTHLSVRHYHQILADQNAQLEERLQQQLTDLFRLQNATLTVMISLAEFRDEETGNHIKRTQLYVQKIVEKLYSIFPELDERRGRLIVQAAPLHDVGKITTPDEILLKPGKLTPEEFDVMKKHAEKGSEILGMASKEMGEYGDFLLEAQAIAKSHHEKWDGSGYPEGLNGETIPLGARIMAVADVYDALRSERPYKVAMSHDQALEIICSGKGSHFDPKVVDAFCAQADTIAQIADSLQD